MGERRDCTCPRYEHGTNSAYTMDGCRCVACGQAHSEAWSRYRQGVRTRPQPSIDEMAVERRMAGDRSVLLNGPERREATLILTRLGYSAELIAERLGYTKRTIHRHRRVARQRAAA